MVKRIIITIVFIVVICAGAFGTYHFYSENQNQIQQNQALAAQNAQVQAELDAIGQLVTVYEVSAKMYSGKQIKETDLIPVSVPASTCSTTSITDISQLVGKYYKIDIQPGTILSTDMLMEEVQDTAKRYPRELTFTSLPVSTVVGDYVDIRVILPNGEEYVVLAHEQIQRIYEQTITINISEEENAILNSVFADMGSYSGYMLCYLTKYIEPGKDVDTVAFYPVVHDMETFLQFNPNIEDVSRCVNPTLRDHIDKVLLVYTDSYNQSVAQGFIQSLEQQYTAQLQAHQLWIEEHTDDEGNLQIEGNEQGGNSGNFDQEVGDAMNGLEEDLGDLEAIQ